MVIKRREPSFHQRSEQPMKTAERPDRGVSGGRCGSSWRVLVIITTVTQTHMDQKTLGNIETSRTLAFHHVPLFLLS